MNPSTQNSHFENSFAVDTLAILRHVTWELPQTLLGVLLFLLVKAFDRSAKTFRGPSATLMTRSIVIGGGISLGMFVFSVDYARRVGRKLAAAQQRMECHELGHVRQSCMLGPLYLPVVGVPSFVRAAAFRLTRAWGRPIRADRYYRGYPEAWADRLGGVRRPQR